MRNLKIILVVLLLFTTLTFANASNATAASNITIYVNNEKQAYSNKAIIKSGSTLVPLRGIFEALGANVHWNQTTKTIDASKGSTKIWLKIGSKSTKVNGKIVNIAVPAQVVNGSTLVPLRFIGESLGAQVQWSTSAKTIHIVDKNVPTKPSTKNSVKLHFIDVGQGDATFIQLATGKNILVDAGTDAAGEKVVAYLKSLKIKKIDYVLATHPDADHIGGMVDVLNAFQVDTFIDSGKAHTSKTYENMLLAIQKEGAKYIVPKYGQTFESDQSTDSFFKILNVNESATENNDASLVVKGGYCKNDFMLMGDAGTNIEKELIKNVPNLNARILKAGHHGSNTSSSFPFLKAVQPEAVILSYGANNSYGHPHNEVMSSIKMVGAKAYSTAAEGTIVATINCGGYSIDAAEFDYTEGKPPVTPPTNPQPGTKYKNCTELRKDYPNGVPSSHPAYDKKHDRDGDGWACEV